MFQSSVLNKENLSSILRCPDEIFCLGELRPDSTLRSIKTNIYVKNTGYTIETILDSKKEIKIPQKEIIKKLKKTHKIYALSPTHIILIDMLDYRHLMDITLQNTPLGYTMSIGETLSILNREIDKNLEYHSEIIESIINPLTNSEKEYWHTLSLDPKDFRKIELAERKYLYQLITGKDINLN